MGVLKMCRRDGKGSTRVETGNRNRARGMMVTVLFIPHDGLSSPYRWNKEEGKKRKVRADIYSYFY